MKEIVERMKFKFEDAKLPNQAERQCLLRLLYLAMVDLRVLARENRMKQAEECADIFHNVPLLINNNDFSFKFLSDRLRDYEEKYKETLRVNYLAELDKLASNKT